MGEGYYAHREGYNVLYGDWHVKWYGDPPQRYIWWPMSEGVINETAPAFATDAPCAAGTGSSGLFWYLLLDEAAGVDAGLRSKAKDVL